jgi:hypothetical protein
MRRNRTEQCKLPISRKMSEIKSFKEQHSSSHKEYKWRCILAGMLPKISNNNYYSRF